VQLYKYNKAAHSTPVHNMWLGKSNPTMPKGKRATKKEGHPTLSLSGKSGAALRWKDLGLYCLTVELPSG